MPHSALSTQHSALSLSVQYVVKPDTAPTRPKFRRWVRAALTRDAEITLRLVDEEEGQTLNRDYRGKDYATNVLTFVYDDLSHLAGDIVICPAVVEREALQQGKAVEAHYAHLVVHGVLHLHGYDHESDAQAEEMEQRETQIVTKLGYPDPYLLGDG
ncbi:MAG: rRNA maturation RNase YbeY [Sulfuricellaceae bacterium]